MALHSHQKLTGFSGNEIFCLNKLGFRAGQLCLGNNVLALGVVRGIGAGLSSLAGGEVTEVTRIVHDGRKGALDRMMEEARRYGGTGLAGVSFDLVRHSGNLEFIAMGSTVHQPDGDQPRYSTAADAQALYCQLDAGFTPRQFVFGNVAYSIGVGGSVRGTLRGLRRGEVPAFTEIFDRTRHLALERIKEEAKAAGANAVIGIETTITPLLGAQEMIMIGTASVHPALADRASDPVTSDLTAEEMWNLVSMGYMPVELVMGVSVYSLGLASGIAAFFKSLAGGKIEGLTELLYEAREKAFERVEEAARRCGADEVVGVRTKVYDLPGGLVEFMVIGTAVKRMDGIGTRHDALPPQAIIRDRETLVDVSDGGSKLARGELASSTRAQAGPLSLAFTIIAVFLFVAIKIMTRQ